MDKLRDILYKLIEEDDKKRNKVNYDLSKNIDKCRKKILNLRLKEIKSEA